MDTTTAILRILEGIVTSVTEKKPAGTIFKRLVAIRKP